MHSSFITLPAGEGCEVACGEDAMPTTLNKIVRDRMEKTGESYQQALRHVRAQDGSRREGDRIILGPIGSPLSSWTPDNYSPPTRHEDESRRRQAAVMMAQQNSQSVPPPLRRPPPWVPDQDDDSEIARMVANRQRRNVAAILSSQQSGQALPPLVPNNTSVSLFGVTGEGTVGAISGSASITLNAFGAVGNGTVTNPPPPLRVELIGIAEIVQTWLAADPSMLHQLSPAQFQEFICDRLVAMGQEVKQVGGVYNKDGGIDIVFWPKARNVIGTLGVVQAKHHRDPSKKEGSGSVRDFRGAISGKEFGAAILATNTAFTPDAEWVARQRPNLIRLRDFVDLKRWIANDFSNWEEWREMPDSIELCPGVTVKIPRE